MANQILARRYTANNGNFFTVGVDSEVALQDDGEEPPVLLIGGAAAVAGDLPLPSQMSPRRAICFNAAGKRREVIALTPGALIMTVGTEITLEDSDGASSVYTVDQTRSESYRRRRKVTTT